MTAETGGRRRGGRVGGLPSGAETALNQEMTEHLGHEKHGPVTGETGNVRTGTRGKTVLSGEPRLFRS